MDKITLSGKTDFALTTNALAFMQSAYSMLEKLTALGGDNYIVSGCEVTGSSVSDGYVVLKGILMPFKQGSLQTNVMIKKDPKTINVDTGSREQISYHAEFGSSTNAADNVAWADILKIDTNKALMTQIADIIADIAPLDTNITSNASDIQINTDAIAANTQSISTNSQNIQTLSEEIVSTELSFSSTGRWSDFNTVSLKGKRRGNSFNIAASFVATNSSESPHLLGTIKGYVDPGYQVPFVGIPNNVSINEGGRGYVDIDGKIYFDPGKGGSLTWTFSVTIFS
jgi:hypothetical protein